jgi:hypothetical protein
MPIRFLAALAATSLVLTPAVAAPLRAAGALPSGRVQASTVGAVPRAATPARRASELAGLPIFVFLGLAAGVAVATVVASGGSRSPG